MYTVLIKTDKFDDEVKFYTSQEALYYAFKHQKCMDVTDIYVIDEEKERIGLSIRNGEVEFISGLTF